MKWTISRRILNKATIEINPTSNIQKCHFSIYYNLVNIYIFGKGIKNHVRIWHCFSLTVSAFCLIEVEEAIVESLLLGYQYGSTHRLEVGDDRMKSLVTEWSRWWWNEVTGDGMKSVVTELSRWWRKKVGGDGMKLLVTEWSRWWWNEVSGDGMKSVVTEWSRWWRNEVGGDGMKLVVME